MVGLEYGTDLDRARGVLGRAAQEADGVVDSPPVQVHTSLFGESSIDFLVWFWHQSDFQSGYEVTDSVIRSINQARRITACPSSQPGCIVSGTVMAKPRRLIPLLPGITIALLADLDGAASGLEGSGAVGVEFLEGDQCAVAGKLYGCGA